MKIASLPSIFECLSPRCRFRFPVLSEIELKVSGSCPKCGSPTLLVEVNIQPKANFSQTGSEKKPAHVEVLLDNIRSAYNIGSIFRTADGAGIRHVYLCGVTPTPPQSAVSKTSLGAENSIPWSYHPNARDLAWAKQSEVLIWALEGGQGSTSLFEANLDVEQRPILLVVGNEVSGVDPGILEISAKKLWIPMQGIKESLNVAIAFSIAAYTICFGLRT